MMENLKEFTDPKRELEQYSVNSYNYLAILNRLKEVCRGKHTIDLCCGTGTFTLPVIDLVKRIDFIDIDKDAIDILEQNLRLIGEKQAKVNIVVEDVIKKTYNCDVLVCNPPFGYKTDLFKPILLTIDKSKFNDCCLLIPYQKLNEVLDTIGFNCVKQFIVINIMLKKTYAYHTEEEHPVRCVYLTLSRSETENCEDYIKFIELSNETSDTEISYYPTLANLVGLRVGYIINSVFNGRLACVKNYQEDEGYTITLTNDPWINEINNAKTINLKSFNKRFLYDRTITDDSELRFSSHLKSSLNSTFIVSELLPIKDNTLTMPLIHESVNLTAAIIALKCCLILWPNNLGQEERFQLAVKLIRGVNQKAIEKIFFSEFMNLKLSIKQCCKLLLGEFCRLIEEKVEQLTISEISYISSEIADLDERRYIEFIQSDLPESISKQKSTTVKNIDSDCSGHLNELIGTVNKLKGIIQNKEIKKTRLKYIIDELQINESNSRHKSNVEIGELRNFEFKYKDLINDLKDILDTEQYKEMINKIEEKTPRYALKEESDKNSELFIPDYIKKYQEALLSDTEYNKIFKRIQVFRQVLPKFCDKVYINLDTYEDNKIISEVSSFFKKINLHKVFNISGNIRSSGSVSILINYIYTLINLMKSKKSMSNDDMIKVEIILKDSLQISKKITNLPVQAIINDIIYDFESLEKLISKSALDEFQSLITHLKLSMSYNHAWTIALRLKGLLYEVFFSQSWDLEYIPEDCKHSLLTIIRHTMPDKVDMFIKRTQRHPEVREFKPDFCLVKQPFLRLSDGKLTDTSYESTKSVSELTRSENTEATSSDMSDSKLILSKGKLIGWSEFGSDENIKKAERSPVNLVSNIIQHGVEKKSKGGIYTTQGEKLDVTVEELDEFCPWENVNLDYSSNKYQLYILEVGYQTDQEGKILSDLQKWRIPIDILQSMDIEVVILSAVDRSGIPSEEWWIKPVFVKELKKTIGRLFYQLSKHSPVDVSEHIIGDIGSQKLRISLRTGTLVRPPVLTTDLMDYYSQWRKKLIKRPSGATLPYSFENDFIQSNIFGSTVSLSQNDIEVMFDKIVDAAPDIIDKVKKKHEISETNEDTQNLVLLGWCLEELGNNKCDLCIKKYTSDTKLWKVKDKLMKCIQLLNTESSCTICLNKFGPPIQPSRLVKSFLSEKTSALDRMESLQCELKITSGTNGTKSKKHPFDEFVSMLLPAKTQKQTRIKNMRKKLIELILLANDQIAVKDSKGQILIAHNSKFLMKETEIIDSSSKGRFSVRSLYTIEEDDEELTNNTDLNPLHKKINKEIEYLMLLMSDGYSDYHVRTVSELSENYIFGDSIPKSIIPKEWVERVFSGLNIETTTENYMRSIVGSNSKKAEKSTCNDTFKTMTVDTLEMYLDSIDTEIDMIDKPLFYVDCLIMKEIVEEVVRQIEGTIYDTSIRYIIQTVKILLQFKWFNRVVLYSKICQTFMQVCSEFVHSGIKVKRITHTGLNLLVKVTEKKSSNMVCTVVDKEMSPLEEKSFFLCRRAAVLGQALPYCYITMLVQYLQMFNCCQDILEFKPDDCDEYEEISAQNLVRTKSIVLSLKKGNLSELSDNMENITKDDFNVRKTLSKIVFMNLLSCFNITYGIILGPAMSLNSQLINKQIQTIRYPMMLSLSEFGFIKKLGSKLFSPRRRVECEVLRCWIQAVTYTNLKDCNENISIWKKHQQYPNCIFSYSMCLSPILTDRHLVYDIYLVHLYNKELDDFDQGQIRILDDFAQRHFDFEEDLKSCILSYKSCGKKTIASSERQDLECENQVYATGEESSKSEIDGSSLKKKQKTSKTRIDENKKGSNNSSYFKRRIRLLLGIPKLNVKDKGKDCVKLIKSHGRRSRKEYTLFSLSGDDNGSDSTSSSGGSMDTLDLDKQEASIHSAKSDLSAIEYRTRGSTGYSFTMASGLETVQSNATEYQNIVISRSQAISYKPNYVSVINDILEVCDRFPSYSYASSELIQIFTEYSKQFYNSGALEKARKSKRNWQPITSFMETTSIISEPITEISISESINMIRTQTMKKLTKLLKRRLDASKSSSSKESKECVMIYFNDCMSASPFDDEFKSQLKKELFSTKALDYLSWSTLSGKPITETLLSNDANKTYFWIKSLNKDIRSIASMNKTRINQQGYKCIENFKKGVDMISNGHLDVIFTDDDFKLANETWIKVTRTIMRVKKMMEIDDVVLSSILSDLEAIWTEYEKLIISKKNFPSATFSVEELDLHKKEFEFLNRHKKSLSIIFNLLLAHVLSSPWMSLLNPTNLTQLHAAMISDGSYENNTSRSIIGILTSLMNYGPTFCTLLKIEDKTIGIKLVKYLVSMFHSNEMPFKHLYTNEIRTVSSSEAANAILEKVKSAISARVLENLDSDFFLTVMTMKSKNFAFTKKLLNKSGNDRLPRSTRSKVLYELTKEAQNHKQIILQQLVFSDINNVFHRNFSSLAPKAQYGGDRDLLVQETKTKLINAVSEQWSKAMLDNSSNDALVKPKVKEVALEQSQHLKEQAMTVDGEEYRIPNMEKTDLVNFMSVYCGAADHRKWGPVHNTSTFNAMDMQLVRENSDWSNFLKLVNFKSLIKQIEIPASSINKIIKVFFETDCFKNRKTNVIIEEDIRKLLTESSDSWEWKPHIKFLIDNYLSKGQCAINSYNHMGQGIHHAKSSLFGDVLRRAMIRICEKWFFKQHPALTLSMFCYGSSDDLSMIIQVTGTVPKCDHAKLKDSVKISIMNMLNFWNGISRACQMFLSEKSVFSSCVNEMYSDFDLYHRISPSVIKFTLATIINSTITTPLSFYQSLHVSCQQACFMSTSFLTNLTFCICRQANILIHSENFFRSYGWVVFKLPSSFGRIYIPKISSTVGGQTEVDELAYISDRLKFLLNFLSFCLTKSFNRSEGPQQFRIDLSETERLNLVNRYLESNQAGTKLEPSEQRQVNEKVLKELSDNQLIETDEDNYSKGSTHVFKTSDDAFNLSHSRRRPSFSNSSFSSCSGSEVLEYESDSEEGPVIIGLDSINDRLNSTSGRSSSDTNDEIINPGVPKVVCCEIKLQELFENQFCKHRDLQLDRQVLNDMVISLSSSEQAMSFIRSIIEANHCTSKDAFGELCSSILTCVILNYYEFGRNLLGDYSSKSERLGVHLSIEDPFLHILPGKVRNQLIKLNLLRREIRQEKLEEDIISPSYVEIAKRLTEQNVKTEDYNSEFNRISQIASSRNIQNGLSGGLKDNSIPHMRQVLRSYYFYDKTGIMVHDHWPLSVDKSITTNNSKLTSPVSRVKYSEWIRVLLKSSLFKKVGHVAPRSKPLDILMEPKLLDIICVYDKDSSEIGIANIPKLTIVFDTESISSIVLSTEKLVKKLAIENKITLQLIEKSNISYVIPAYDAKVSKTKIFSKESRVRFYNNPAVIISHMIDHISASSCKPIGVNYGHLESDKSSMSTHYPEVMDLINKAKESHQLPDRTIDLLVRALSNISRSISDSGLTSTPMYCFKPIRTKYEDSMSSFVNYNVVEGLELKTDEQHVRDSAFSETYFRILECISLISSLPVDDGKKTLILTQFLNWNPKQYNENIITESGTTVCKDIQEETSLMSKFSDEPISMQLIAEASNIKNPDDRKSVMNIANYVLDKKQVIANSQRTDCSLNFKIEGLPFKDGRYQLNCEFGTSCGYFINGSLICVLSHENKQLLRTLETEVLQWCHGIRTATVTQEQHQKFIKILCTNFFGSNFVSGGKPMAVSIIKENDCRTISLLNTNDASKNCVFIKHGIITTHCFQPYTLDQTVHIRWGRGYLQMYILREAEVIEKSIYHNSVIRSLNALTKDNKQETFDEFKEQKVIISSSKLPNTVSKPSAYLMHVFLWHKMTMHDGLSKTRKDKIKGFFKGEGSINIRKSVLNDQTLLTINSYLLSESKKAEEKSKKSFIKGVTMFNNPFFETAIGGVDSEGTYKIDNEGNKSYLDTSDVNFLPFTKQLNKCRLEMTHDYNDLPDIPGLSLLKELKSTLNVLNYEKLIQDVQKEINKQFNGIDGFPFIKLILEELNLGSVTFNPSQSPIDNKLVWKINKPDDLKEMRIGRNVYDSLMLIKTGSIPISMSFLVFVKSSVSSYFDKISHLCGIISALPFTRKQITSAIAIILTIDKPKLYSDRFSYNWLDLLSGILPTTIKSRKGDSSIMFSSSGDYLKMSLNVFLEISTIESCYLNVDQMNVYINDIEFTFAIPIENNVLKLFPSGDLVYMLEDGGWSGGGIKNRAKEVKKLLKSEKTFDEICKIKHLKIYKTDINKIGHIRLNKELTKQIRIKESVCDSLNALMPGKKLFGCTSKSSLRDSKTESGINYYMDIDNEKFKNQFKIEDVISNLFKISQSMSNYLLGVVYLILEQVLSAELSFGQKQLATQLLSSKYNPTKNTVVYFEKKHNDKDTNKESLTDIIESNKVSNIWYSDNSDEDEDDLNTELEQDEKDIEDIFDDDSGGEDDFIITADDFLN